MDTTDNLDTIDVELDEFFKKKQRSRCKDEFLDTLTKEALDEYTVPEINLNSYVYASGPNAYEVIYCFPLYGVNLEGIYCTCRLWELSGIPCVHSQTYVEDVPFESQYVPESQPIPSGVDGVYETREEEDDDEDEVDETQEDDDEEDRVDDT
ncbi:unnamed protein product [Lactuca saligna]|uniref:SWIM-type domain-containing protein n=1 Tax=Lactuca saligna TaxID=75948 RepID=A0AA35Y648_LACSI|nr:unnamed protein product [Lactuca saligna]